MAGQFGDQNLNLLEVLAFGPHPDLLNESRLGGGPAIWAGSRLALTPDHP